MAKQTLSANQSEVIAAIIPQMEDGENWNGAHSCAAIARLAVKHCPSMTDEQRKAFKAELPLLVNPSQCAQFLDKLPTTDSCYRKRNGSLASKLDTLD